MVARIDFIIASLKKAGVPPDELQHFKNVVSKVSLADGKTNNRDRPAGTVASDDGETVAEGVLEKLQRGTHGFAPVWKSRWIRILSGEMQVFASTGRPEAGTPCLFRLPLSVQQTRIDPGKMWESAVAPHMQLLMLELIVELKKIQYASLETSRN